MASPERELDNELRDFEIHTERKNIGNFPDELDNDPRMRAMNERPEPVDPEPEPEPEPSPVDREDVEEDVTPVGDPKADRLEALELRLAQREREMEFLRLGQSQSQPSQQAAQRPADPVAMIDQYLGGLKVTPEDIQTILQDPVRGAEYLMNGIRAAAAAGASIATNQLRGEYYQRERMVQGATQLRDNFYGAHPDLQPYAKLVQQTAGEVRAAYPQIDPPSLIEMTSARVRGQLKEWGVAPTRAQAARGARARVRPAAGETSGGYTANSARAGTRVENQLREFERQSDRYYQS